MEKLHPGVKWLFRIRGYFGALFILIFLSGFIIPAITGVIGISSGGNLGSFVTLVIVGFFVYVSLIIIIAEIYARMAYNRWFYEFTSTNLKVERGIIWKRYSNIPYERVQNVEIQRGIIARLFGFSTVDIQTAGFHGGYGRRGMPRSEGHLPAVSIDAADKIRDFLMKKITKNSKSGL